MENLVNKKVRLRNRLTGSTIVACSDKESVTHVKLDDNKPKPENSVWVIKTKNLDNKSVRLESVYNKLLGISTSSEGLTVSQIDMSNKNDTRKIKGHTWWTFEDVDNSGFACVQIKLLRDSDHGVYLYPDSEAYQVKLRKGGLPWWASWLLDRVFYWDIEIVETPQAICKSEDSPKLQEIVNGIPTSAYTYQVDRMYVRNVYKNRPRGNPARPIPFINNDVNTGYNVNDSGTQIIGGVNVQTRINRLVNNNTVNRDD